MNNNDFKISKKNAEIIYNKFISSSENNSYKNSIISIEGDFGSGKTTTKEELLKLLKTDKSRNIILVDYIALQLRVSWFLCNLVK